MPNVEELQLGLKLVELGAEAGRREWTGQPVWSQADWVSATRLDEGFCLTSGCFAGHVMMHAGFTLPLMDNDGHVFAIKNPLTGEMAVMEEDEPDSIANLAGERLGLDRAQRAMLFDGDNTLDDIRAIVAELCQE